MTDDEKYTKWPEGHSLKVRFLKDRTLVARFVPDIKEDESARLHSEWTRSKADAQNKGEDIKRVDFSRTFEVPVHCINPRDSMVIRQDGVVFMWNEIDIRYKPADDAAFPNWGWKEIKGGL